MTPSKETRRAEGRDQPGRSPHERGRVRTQSRVALPTNLARVNVAARAAVQTRFTALLHHIDVEALERAFRRQKRQASAGVDGITVAEYEQNLEASLQDLCGRVHTGRYRPQPVRRVYIPKADGGRRPLGVPTLEDKIVQGAVAETLRRRPTIPESRGQCIQTGTRLGIPARCDDWVDSEDGGCISDWRTICGGSS